MVSKDLWESDSSFKLKDFEGKEILLPQNKAYIPLQENFEWHRKRFEFE
jgi:predicted restriction endonuclease